MKLNREGVGEIVLSLSKEYLFGKECGISDGCVTCDARNALLYTEIGLGARSSRVLLLACDTKWVGGSDRVRHGRQKSHRPNVEPIIYTDEFTWWRRSLYHVRYRGHRQEGRARV